MSDSFAEQVMQHFREVAEIAKSAIRERDAARTELVVLRNKVERLRGHFARLRDMVDPDSDLACVIDAALSGAEVPE